MNKWRLTIEADTNDADYVSESIDLTYEEWNNEYKPIIEKIVPALIANSEQPLGIHSIVGIQVTEIGNIIKYL